MSDVADLTRILEGLNPAQKSAVTSPFSVVQILAPPGSGKTKTLTSRVSWLLKHEGYLPWNIVCLTFTNKSAREMQERVAKQITSGLEAKLVLGTFHSVCLRYLRYYGHLIGLPKKFLVADASDTKAIILRIVKDKKLTIDPNVAKNRISKCKARNESCEEVLRKAKKGVDQQEFQTVYEEYQRRLKELKCLDFDDLLMLCVQLLQKYPECVSNVEAVLIDEFQDTNDVQFTLMRLFAQRQKRITTVGDPDQSIYGWRSAEIKNLERMRDLFPDIQVVHLEDNYRSSGAILRAAQEVIEQDDSRPEKSLQATHCGGTKPVLRLLFSPEAEAQWTVAEIKRCLCLTGGSVLTYSDFAILVRSASQSRQLELAMGNSGIPYRMVGGVKFFDRAEVKVLLDYLRIISNTGSSDAIARVLPVPSRGVAKETARELLDEALAVGKPLWDLIRDTIQGVQRCKTKISKQAERGLEIFFNLIENSRKKLVKQEGFTSLREMLKYIINRLDFRKHLEKAYRDDTENVRGANVDQLLAQASDTDAASALNEEDPDALPELEAVEQRARGTPGEEALSSFLSSVALATDNQTREEADVDGQPRPRVTISTMHAAKGLEWPVVFVPSAYHGSIPHSRAEDHDEERRLLYVAMTRAQTLLYISCPTRNPSGDETTLSPFLDTREVRSCMVDQGPSLHAHRIFDISRILRRAEPTYDDLIEAEKRTLALDDDECRWPLDGSAGQHEASRLQKGFFPGSRSESTGSRQNATAAADVVDSGTVSVSVSQAAGIAGGFMSASSQLKLQQEDPDRMGIKPLSNGSAKANVSPKKQKLQKHQKGQSTLTKIWFEAPQQSAYCQDLKLRGRVGVSSDRVVGAGLKQEPESGNTGSSQQHRSKPGKISIVQRNTATETDHILPRADNTITLRPCGTVPNELAHHVIRPGPSLKRRAIDYEASGSRKRRVWAPGTTSASDLHGTSSLRSLPQVPASMPCESPVPGNIKTQGGSSTTSTLHKTTMSELQERDSVPKRTLGVRRSNVSWPSKLSVQQFKVPQLSRCD
ncbi:hypothetical protein MMC10_006875 [Thelotrema lepadinum]|nr:hypothetical protein [Thelotrema lepadinum]